MKMRNYGMKMMNGKNKEIYNKQLNFQKKITKNTSLPKDDIYWFSYHVQALIEEMGEVLRADKRWKSHRNQIFNSEEKMKELADVYITVLNLIIFSGISYEQFQDTVLEKIEENLFRLSKEDL